VSVLSGDQFGRKTGDYRGEPGEPDPNTYGHYDDFLADHKRWIHAMNTGKRFVDRDAAILRNADREDTKASEQEAMGEYRAHVEKVTERRKQVRSGINAIKRSLPAPKKAGPLGGLGRTRAPRRRGGL